MADTPTDDARAAVGLDRLLHENARLGILTALLARPAGLSFTDLKATAGLTDGNLSRHLATLADNGLVEQHKKQGGGRPQTVTQLTAAGRERFLEYLSRLESIVTAALAAAGRSVVAPAGA